jgi:hypothetical protein
MWRVPEQIPNGLDSELARSRGEARTSAPERREGLRQRCRAWSASKLGRAQALAVLDRAAAERSRRRDRHGRLRDRGLGGHLFR